MSGQLLAPPPVKTAPVRVRFPLWRAWAWALAKVERERYRRARLGVKR